MSDKKNGRRWLRVCSAVTLLLVLLAGALLFSLPSVIQYGAIKHLVERNLDATSIENIDLNLFTGDVEVEGFSAIGNEFQGISVARLKLHMHLLKALQRTIHLDEVRVDSLTLNLQQTSSGNLVFGYQSQTVASANAEPVATEQPLDQQPWRILIDSLRLTNNQLVFNNANADARILLQFDTVLQGFNADSTGQLAFKRLTVNNLEVFLQERPTLQWSKLEIENFDIFEQGMSLGALTLNDLIASLTRLPEGDLHILKTLGQFTSGDAGEKASSENESNPDTAPFAWKIGSINVTGDSRVRFSDNVFTPGLKNEIAIDKFTMSAIDSLQPDNKTSTDIIFSTGSGEDLIRLSGDLKPLLPQPAANLAIDLEHINLTDWSAYVAQAIGYSIQTGVLDLESQVTLAQNKLNVENALQLHKLKLQVSDAEGAAEFDKKMTLPLGTALNILQDGDGNISLTVPIDGSLNDPKFRLGAAINGAIAQALKAASMSYLKYAIQPWGAALFVGEQLTGRLGKITFEPVVFAAGESSLNENAKAYLDKLSEMLKKKNKLGITACPVHGANDKAQLFKGKKAKTATDEQINEQLDTLANNRYKTVKNYMVEQHQIEGKRIIKCRVEKTEAEAGVVELRL